MCKKTVCLLECYEHEDGYYIQKEIAWFYGVQDAAKYIPERKEIVMTADIMDINKKPGILKYIIRENKD